MPLLGSQSVPWDLSYHKEHQYIWGSEQMLRQKAFYEPQLVSLDASVIRNTNIYGLGVGIRTVSK